MARIMATLAPSTTTSTAHSIARRSPGGGDGADHGGGVDELDVAVSLEVLLDALLQEGTHVL